MKHITAVPSIILALVLSAVSASAQRNVSLADNAALRYWSAFSAVQDSAITDEQARELNAILDGTAPYDDLKYKDLLEKEYYKARKCGDDRHLVGFHVLTLQ